MTTPPLSPPARLGAQLATGALLLVVAAALFGAIAHGVVDGDRLTRQDELIAQWLHRHATPALTSCLLVVTDLHSNYAVGTYSAFIAAWLARRREWRRATTVFVCIGGVIVLNILMKLAFQRARPVFADPLLTLASYSFPSGHVAGTTVFYGLAVAWLFAKTRELRWRVLAIAGALAMIALVAFSRMYLGVHYLSDVGAAFAEGVAWLAICLSALAAFWRRAPAAP